MPLRTCIGCRARRPQGELVRAVRRDGRLVVGRSLPGRGAWLCDGSPSCLDLASKRRAFDRAFRGPVEPDAVASLREYLVEMRG